MITSYLRFFFCPTEYFKPLKDTQIHTHTHTGDEVMFSFCGPSPKFVMKFNIHSLLCDNRKQFTHSAATGELINSEILFSPLAVMTLTQKTAELVGTPNHTCMIALILDFNCRHTHIQRLQLHLKM
jgi:hypothetical protein